MVFNWFRRKFDNSEPEQEAPLESETEVIVEEAPSEVVAEPQTPDAGVATDYLAWAKAAYDNIQQQAASSPTAPVALVEPTTDDEPELVVSTELASPPAAIQNAPTTPDPIESPDLADTQTLPIWARDDRQQRLEQLKAAAIETVDPEAPAADLALDDDFLWSAKVLADGGRTPEQVSLDEINWLKKLRQGLDKTRRGFVINSKP